MTRRIRGEALVLLLSACAPSKVDEEPTDTTPAATCPEDRPLLVVRIQPEDPRTDHLLAATWVACDAVEDVTLRWTPDPRPPIADLSWERTTIPASLTERGQTWTVRATGRLDRDEVVSEDQVVIGDTPPTNLSAQITTSVAACPAISCSVGWSDPDLPDGEPDLSFTWTVDGVADPSRTRGVLDPGGLPSGTILTCSATWVDGDTTLVAHSAPFVLEGAALLDRDADGLCDAEDPCPEVADDTGACGA